MAESSQVHQCDSDNLNNLNESSQISIAWNNLTYSVNEFKQCKFKKTVLLNGLNGFCCSGSLNGILGPSGSGKTTLLNCLSGTTSSGLSEESAIYLNESATSKSSFISYYIHQSVHESIFSELTVGEILRYAFAFKNDEQRNSATTEEIMHQHITKTMAQLMLAPDLQLQPFAICSGGEQKRIAIAQELMALTVPSILFLDEPTSGLDSSAAFEVVLCLKKLTAKQNITVIASIHAPNDETLNLFDQLYVLAKGGVAIYSGVPKQIKEDLKVKLNLTISNQQPPIEVLLKIACNGNADANVTKLAKQNLTSKSTNITSHLATLTYQPNGLPTHRKLFSFTNFITQLVRLFRITFITKIRSQLLTILLLFIFFGLLSTIYSSTKAISTGCYSLLANTTSTTCNNEDKLDADNLVKENGHYLSYVILIVGLIVMITSQVYFISLVKVFQSEHRNYWYSLGVFYWSSTIISLLEISISSILLTTITYFFSNQHAADGYTLNWTRLSTYLLFIWLLSIFYQAIGHLIGVIFINFPAFAFIFAQLLYSLTTLNNGLYIKPNRIGQPVVEMFSNYLGLISITRIGFYSIYGIDRCNGQIEYSWVLLDYNVEVEKMNEYVLKILINVVIMKLATLVVMYLKFSNLKIKKSSKGQPKLNNDNGHDNAIITTADELKDIGIEAKISKDEVEFKHFSVGKILIAWRNLSLITSNSDFFNFNKLKSKQSGATILNQLNGQFTFGTLNALMGTSGSGKTSLLRVLNGQCKTRLSEETSIYLSQFTPIHACFITQEVSGHLMPGLTTKQMLTYASKLKNARKDVSHEGIALKWLQELDLLDIAQTKVEKCSGGERKRLAVALELTSIEMPNLICIDEPTSGLDTNSAEIVIATLRKLTRRNPLTIITSIHQPTTEVLYMFAQLYVLSRDGICIYSGPPDQIHSHLNEMPPRITEVVASQYPIETLIKHSCSDGQSEAVQMLFQLNDQQYGKSDDLQLLLEQTQLTPDGVLQNRPRFSFNSVLILSNRFLHYIKGYLWKEWLFTFFSSIGYAAALRLFFRTDMIYSSGCLHLEDDLASCNQTFEQIENEFLVIDNLRYSYFFTTIYMLLVVLSSSINFFYEIPYFVNEHRNGWYSTGSYYLMKSIFEILPLLPTILLFVYIINIYDPVVPIGMYWNLVSFLLIAAIAFLGMGHCFSLLGRGSLTNQTILLTGTFMLFGIIGNFIIAVSKMHYIWRFLSNFSICKWLFNLTVLLQYGFGRCLPKQLSSVLYSMTLSDDDYYSNVAMLFFNLVFYRVVAIYLLIRSVNSIENRRKRDLRIVNYQGKLIKKHCFV